MVDLKATFTNLPAGGGAFGLENLTIGIFRNDQPSHRLAVGSDKIQDYPFKANQGWILAPGATGVCHYDAPLDVLMVEVAPSVMAEVGLTNLENLAPVVGDLDPLTLQLALSVESFAQGGSLYRETMHRALAAQLANTLRPVDGPSLVLEDLRLRRVVDYIHAHLAEDLSLDTLADIATMSGYHFSRAFKASTGKSPLQYVISERIDLAKVLLKTTKLSVSEICYRTGYQDLSRFGQHFKRATGATPSQYRR